MEESAKVKNKVLVHGVFLYKCEKCGCMEPMYLEKGVESLYSLKMFNLYYVERMM